MDIDNIPFENTGNKPGMSFREVILWMAKEHPEQLADALEKYRASKSNEWDLQLPFNIEYGLNSVQNFRLFNFATGSYNCTCIYCKKNFIGDKRAIQCLSCAIKQAEANIKNQELPCPRNCNLPTNACELGFIHCPYCGRKLFDIT
jgi:hypothetical protein